MELNEITKLAIEFEGKSPEQILSFATSQFGDKVSLASSFGAEDMVLIHMLSKQKPGARVFVLNTGFLFKETLSLIEEVKKRYSLKIEIYEPVISIEEMEKEYGKDLYRTKPDLCCKIRKIEPLKRALSGLTAWITGIRRDQTPQRANAKKIEYDNIFKLVKFNPLADWSFGQVMEYIQNNKVLYNTLHDQNYLSIGCEPCTRPVAKGEDARAGRWTGSGKTECGLHFDTDGNVVRQLDKIS